MTLGSEGAMYTPESNRYTHNSPLSVSTKSACSLLTAIDRISQSTSSNSYSSAPHAHNLVPSPEEASTSETAPVGFEPVPPTASLPARVKLRGFGIVDNHVRRIECRLSTEEPLRRTSSSPPNYIPRARSSSQAQSQSSQQHHSSVALKNAWSSQEFRRISVQFEPERGRVGQRRTSGCKVT